jgi:hypothetical protein
MGFSGKRKLLAVHENIPENSSHDFLKSFQKKSLDLTTISEKTRPPKSRSIGPPIPQRNPPIN